MSAVGCGCWWGSPVSKGHKVVVALSSIPERLGCPGVLLPFPGKPAGPRPFPPLHAALEKARLLPPRPAPVARVLDKPVKLAP